jgi:hypothetical protein
VIDLKPLSGGESPWGEAPYPGESEFPFRDSSAPLADEATTPSPWEELVSGDAMPGGKSGEAFQTAEVGDRALPEEPEEIDSPEVIEFPEVIAEPAGEEPLGEAVAPPGAEAVQSRPWAPPTEVMEGLEAQIQFLREENRIFRETLQKLAILLIEQQARAKQGDEELLRLVREIADRPPSKGLLGRIFS